jgi:Glycosyl transferase family 2
MRIALIDAFPLARYTAEHEFIARCIKVLKTFGHDAIKVATTPEIMAYNPDLVISTHDLAPKLTDHFTIGVLWSPTQFYKNDEARLQNIRSWDLVVPIDETTRQFAVDLHFPVRHRKAVSRNILYPSAPIIDIPAPKPENLSLAYIGVHWDGVRHEEFFRLLAAEVDLHVYGPPEAWKFLPQAYRGSLPFDGKSVFDTLNKHGAVLALHNESHREEDTPSMRAFEACAAKCLVITDAMPSLQGIFGGALHYIDWKDGIEQGVQTVKAALESARGNPSATSEKIAQAHRIFCDRVSLEALLSPIIAEAEEHLARRQSPAIDSPTPTISVIIRCGARPVSMISRAVRSIERQSYPNIYLIFVQFGAVAGFDDYVGQLRDGQRFSAVDVIKVDGDTRRSATLWAGLRAVKTPFFAILDDDDEWFSQHLADIIAEFERDEDADFVHSGGICHNEDGPSPDLHPRLHRPDECGDKRQGVERARLNRCRRHEGIRVEPDRVILTHEEIGDAVVVATSPPQPANAPGVDHLSGAGRKDQPSDLGRAARAAPRSVTIVHDAVGQGPSAAQDAAAVSPAAGHVVAAVNSERLAGRVGRARDESATSAENVAGNVRLQIAGGKRVPGSDGCAPGGRAINPGDLLDHPDIVDNVEFWPV